MKITFKSVFAIVKNLFNGAVKFIFNDATFSSELITRQWVVYRELKAGLVKAGEWKVAEWKETLRKALATAKILLKSEKMGMVQFKKVNEGNVIYTRKICWGI